MHRAIEGFGRMLRALCAQALQSEGKRGEFKGPVRFELSGRWIRKSRLLLDFSAIDGLIRM